MENTLIAKALGLPEEDTSDRIILDRITELRTAAGEDADDDLTDRELLRRGQHEAISVTDDGAAVTLYYPLKSGTEMIETITIRRPRARDLKRMQEAKGSDYAKGISMLADVATTSEGRKLSVPELDNLDATDSNNLMMVVGFLQRTPRRTGRKS
jgi:hypothetical protein